jgi:sporulation protein YlmC with PRC-barrel domain
MDGPDTDATTQIKIGSEVLDKRGSNVGRLEFVIVRPPEMEVTNIVIATGSIRGRDILVPANLILRAGNNNVELAVSKRELDSYPDFIRAEYKHLPRIGSFLSDQGAGGAVKKVTSPRPKLPVLS